MTMNVRRGDSFCIFLFFTPTFGSCSTGRLSSRIRQHAYCKSRTGGAHTRPAGQLSGALFTSSQMVRLDALLNGTSFDIMSSDPLSRESACSRNTVVRKALPVNEYSEASFIFYLTTNSADQKVSIDIDKRIY